MSVRREVDVPPRGPGAAARASHLLAWALAALALTAGLWWRDCALLAGAALLGVASFRAGMDAGAPWPSLHAGLRCGLGGAVMLVLGLLLLVWVAAVQWGTMPPSPGHADAVTALAAAAVVAAMARLASGSCAWHQLAWTVGIGMTATVAASLAAQGWRSALCWFAGVAAVLVMAEGWRLLHDVMPAFLESERRW